MSIKKMSKEELELLSTKDITNMILEESKKPLNTADLFRKIIELLELPQSHFDTKIAEYYTSLATDKRFVLLDNGTWDLKSRYKSDMIAKIADDDEDEEEEESEDREEEIDDIEEDNYDDQDEEYDEDANEELKDLVIIDEDELEMEN